jgi:hypothetical protein
MPLVELKRQASDREVRQFALLWLPGFCLVAAAVGYLWFDAPRAAVALLVAAGASCLCGVLVPQVMRVVLLAWMWLTYPLSWLASYVLLAAVYFLVITPIGMALRALGRDPLELQMKRAVDTYWQPRTADSDRQRYFRQF